MITVNNMENVIKKYMGLTSFHLKLLAISTMFCDHFAVMFLSYRVPSYLLLRCIGRLAFPIYAFLIVEGFIHTRDVKKYALRLGIFALLSEIPFDLLLTKTYVSFAYQNVFFTLLIGLLVIAVTDYLVKHKMYWAYVLIPLLGGMLAVFLKTDYDFYGVLVIYLFYVFREKTWAKFLSVSAVLAFGIGGVEVYGLLSFIPIFLYNGKKGPDFLKYFFYVFYPAHLLFLYLLYFVLIK